MGTPLSLIPFQGQRLSVVIYWHPPKEPANGHAALIIDTQSFDPGKSDHYVSWMGAGGKNGFQQPGAAQTFTADSIAWVGPVPTRWVALKKLHFPAMQQAWHTLRTKPNAHWKLFDKNCATTVARVLKAGGADAYATTAQNQAVWWPTDLIRYARSMGIAVHSTT